MSKLDDLVPPLELCKQIPDGKFADSALVWGGDQFYQSIRVLPRGCQCVKLDAVICPAPTLEEILREMAKYPHRFNNLTCDAYEEMDFGVTAFVPYRGKPGSTLTEYRDGSGATAALKLWLEVRK